MHLPHKTGSAKIAANLLEHRLKLHLATFFMFFQPPPPKKKNNRTDQCFFFKFGCTFSNLSVPSHGMLKLQNG